MNRANSKSLAPTERLVSTARAAAAIGVSVTTVKRWVDEGILPAQRTPGGHRKLWIADVKRLAREGLVPESDLNRLEPQAPDEAKPDECAAALADALRAGNAANVRRILHDAYRRHLWPIELIADAIVSPAMAAIGHGWATGEIDVYCEHRGTQLCMAALYDLKAQLELQEARNRPVAVGGAPEFDHYALPSLCAQMTLLDAGWNSISIGPNTPAESLRKTLDDFRPRLLWLSVSYLADADRFVAEYAKLFRAAAAREVAVAIGGRALTEEVRRRVPYTTYGDGLSHLAAFARTLHPPPRRPRRGRPPRA